MVKERAFSYFISSRYRYEIDRAIGDYAFENSDSFSLERIEEVTCIDCLGFDVKKSWIRDLPELKIEFDIAVVAELVFTGRAGLSTSEETKDEWFLVTATVDFDDLDEGFSITEIQIYDRGYNPHIDYNESLTPCISDKDTEHIAEKFLQTYYPETLQDITPVNVDTVVNRMGLTYEKRHLSSDLSIFGQIFFAPSETETYPDDSVTPIIEKFQKGTILIDDRVFFLRNYGSVRHTIIHECIHWYLHRKKFLLAQCLKEAGSGYKCRITGEQQVKEKSNEAWFLEWQANKIASKVLVPQIPLKMKFNEYLRAERELRPGTANVYLLGAIMKRLSDFFGVSLQVIKIRLEECGLSMARGLFDYCDGRYLKPYAFKKDSLKENETYTIGCADLILETMKNPELGELMRNAQLVYSDSHLVINDPRYIEQKEHGRELTEYARLHLDECGIKFTIETTTSTKGTNYYRECILCRGFTGALKAGCKFDGISNKDKVAQAKAIKQHQREANKLMDCIIKSSLTASIINLMKEKKITVETLAERSSISDRQVTRLRTGETEQPELETIVAIAIGLDIPEDVSTLLLEVAGHTLLAYKEEHMLYKFFLSDPCEMPIKECNEMLIANGYEPLNSSMTKRRK